MAKYFVRDTHGFVTVVEAETCAAIQGTFEFRNDKGMTLVASFPIHSTISVVEVDNAWQDIFPNEEPPEDEPASCCEVEEESDTCLDCLVEDLLNSEKFITGIAEIAADVVDEYFEPGVEQENPVEDFTFSAPETAPPVDKIPVLTVLKGVSKINGERILGFLTPDNKLVNYFPGEENFVLEGIRLYQEDNRGWHYVDPDDYCLSEVKNG